MIRARFIPIEEAERILMQAIEEVLVREGWERGAIVITKVDPFGDGLNGYQCEQGTVRAQVVCSNIK